MATDKVPVCVHLGRLDIACTACPNGVRMVPKAALKWAQKWLDEHTGGRAA